MIHHVWGCVCVCNTVHFWVDSTSLVNKKKLYNYCHVWNSLICCLSVIVNSVSWQLYSAFLPFGTNVDLGHVYFIQKIHEKYWHCYAKMYVNVLFSTVKKILFFSWVISISMTLIMVIVCSFSPFFFTFCNAHFYLLF